MHQNASTFPDIRKPFSGKFPYVQHIWEFESKPPYLAARRGGGMTARQRAGLI